METIKREEEQVRPEERRSAEQSKCRPSLYRVQTGAFMSYDNAANMVNRLQNEGYPAFVIYDGGIYRVQVGAYELLDNAIRMEQNLRGNGYATFIVTG